MKIARHIKDMGYVWNDKEDWIEGQRLSTFCFVSIGFDKICIQLYDCGRMVYS